MKINPRFLKDKAEQAYRAGVHGADVIGSKISQGVDKAAGATANGIKRTGGAMVKDTTPGIANLWTGKRESKVAIGAAFGVAAVYGTYDGMKQTALAPKVGQVSYGGTAPIMNADGVSTTPQAPMANAPTLGANGQMVFGLHQARKG